MNRKLMLVPLALATLAILSACSPPPATCPTGDLMAPVPVFPAYGDIVNDLKPSFTWTYPDDCDPEGYRIDVTTYGGYDYGVTQSGGTGDPSTSWSPAESLEPATDYEWRAAPINGTTLGPYSVSTRFWTGPLCATAGLVAPNLLQPADNSTVDNPFPPLAWKYPDVCVPETYQVDLSSDSSFSGPSLVADFGTPATAVIPASALSDCTQYYWRVTPENSDGSGPTSPTFTFFTDFGGTCDGGTPAPTSEAGAATPTSTGAPASDKTQLKVSQDTNCRGGPGNDYDRQGGVLVGDIVEVVGKPPSGEYAVVLLPGPPEITCWVWLAYAEIIGSMEDLPIIPVPPTPTPVPGSISGIVWRDQCDLLATPMPSNCTVLNNPPWASANGVMEASEPRFQGVIVSLGSGACPSSGLATATTNSNGVYNFSNLAPGDYCISIDVLGNATNTNILIPGGWTYPTSGGNAFYNVTLGEGEDLSGYNFGWMWQFGN